MLLTFNAQQSTSYRLTDRYTVQVKCHIAWMDQQLPFINHTMYNKDGAYSIKKGQIAIGIVKKVQEYVYITCAITVLQTVDEETHPHHTV